MLERIENAPYGRIATAAAGEVDIFAVNHRVRGGAIFFRTAAGTKLIELTIHSSVAFQVDGIARGEAFSVVVKGHAEQLERAADIEHAELSGARPWAPEEKDRWVRITPESVAGRAFMLADHDRSTERTRDER